MSDTPTHCCGAAMVYRAGDSKKTAIVRVCRSCESEHAVTDEDLLSAWCTGDREASEHLIDSKYAIVYKWARRSFPRDHETAKEVAQNVFEVATRRRNAIEGRFQAFLWGVTRKCILAALRNRHRAQDELRSSLCARLPSAESIVAADRRDAWIESVLGELPRADAELLYLYFQCGWTWRETADAVGGDEISAKNRAHRVLRNLRTQLRTAVNASDKPDAALSELARWIEDAGWLRAKQEPREDE